MCLRGGLVGIYGAFWYITVLFLSLIVFNGLIKRNVNLTLLLIICLLLSYIFQYCDVSVFWNAQVVPMALFFMTLGYIYRQQSAEDGKMVLDGNAKKLLYLFMGCSFIVPFFFPILEIDMKLTKYGLPIVSLFVALLMCFGIMLFTQWLERYKIGLTAGLIYIGKSSLVIMFLHQFVNHVMMELLMVQNAYIRFAFSLFLPVIAYYLFQKSRMTRMLFVGVR